MGLSIIRRSGSADDTARLPTQLLMTSMEEIIELNHLQRNNEVSGLTASARTEGILEAMVWFDCQNKWRGW